MDQIIVRTASMADLGRLLEFEQAIIGTERPYDGALRSGEDVHYYDLEDLISSPDVEVVVAETADEIIGSGYARIETSEAYLKHREHSYLGFMYVVPEYRGKGVNKKIVKALEEWTVSQGVNEMQLEVYVQNEGAIRAYEKSGYSGLILQMRKHLTTD
jgi:GNAT superfamily N-acetyltransferase